MNPQTAAPTMPRPMVNDIAAPARQPQLQARPQHVPAAVTPPAASRPAPTLPAIQPSPTLTTSLVANIPVHTPQQPGAPASEDDELDKIMQDVGKELKKDDQAKAKNHFSLFHKQKAAPAPIAARPPAAPPAVPAQPVAAHPAPAQAVIAPQPVSQPATAAQPRPAPAAAKPKKEPSVPLMPITAAVIVTGLLMAAAVYTYR